MDQFVAHGGLTALFDALETMGREGLVSFQDACLQLECVACIKSVMNSEFGLVFVIKSTDFMHRLAESKYMYWLVYIRTCRALAFEF